MGPALRLGKTRENLVGRVFGRLTVLRFSHTDTRRQSYWRCRCKCGSETLVGRSNLVTGGTVSCGCFKASHCLMLGRLSKTHGETCSRSHTKEYRAWCSMKRRCYNPKSLGYENYGGRGITVCERWLNSFKHFLEDVGRAPTKDHSIDRVEVNGLYEPGNVIWATKSWQNKNQRRWLEKAA